MKARVAVVGAGIAGLACARALREVGVSAVVLDKGRAPGGRVATRRLPTWSFDLGAQYFTARTPRFRAEVAAMIDDGACAPWSGRVGATDGRGGSVVATSPTPRFVGVPGMSAIARQLARRLEIVGSARVDRIEPSRDGLALFGEVAAIGTTLPPSTPAAKSEGERRSFGTFDAVALCLPAPQALALVSEIAPSIARTIATVELDPCFALGVAVRVDHPLASIPFDGVFVGRDAEPSDAPLSWIARDSSKPSRAPGERWVLHARADWSRARLDAEPDEVAAELLRGLSRALDVPSIDPEETTLMRWRYAKAPRPLELGALVATETALVVGGDWASGGRVEGAFSSGRATAAAILRHIGASGGDAA
jgi:predicted NAD/FAD-dependent oxidoreductase